MFHTTNGFGTATSRVPMMNVFAPNPFMSAAYMNGVAPSQQQAHAQAFGFHSVQQSQLPAAAPRVVAETSRKRTRTTDNTRPQTTKPRSSEQVPSPTMISVAVQTELSGNVTLACAGQDVAVQTPPERHTGRVTCCS